MSQGIRLISRQDKAAALEDWANALIADPQGALSITAISSGRYRVAPHRPGGEAQTFRSTQEVIRFVKQYADARRIHPVP